jgi:hypothetical protein
MDLVWNLPEQVGLGDGTQVPCGNKTGPGRTD